MTIFLAGLFAGALVFFLGLFGGRKELTAHGQGIIATLSLLAGFIIACLIWITGFLMWVF